MPSSYRGNINSGTVIGAAMSLFLIAVLGYSQLARYEGASTIDQLIAGNVIGYRSVLFDGSPRHYFRVKLEDGLEIKVYDIGVLPQTYKGPVTLSVGKGELSGKLIYQFIDNELVNGN